MPTVSSIPAQVFAVKKLMLSQFSGVYVVHPCRGGAVHWYSCLFQGSPSEGGRPPRSTYCQVRGAALLPPSPTYLMRSLDLAVLDVATATARNEMSCVTVGKQGTCVYM